MGATRAQINPRRSADEVTPGQLRKELQKYLQEISDLIVCPSCLGEKPRHLAVKEEIAGQEVYFCRCPHCIDTFSEKPDYFLQRLEW